MTTRKIVPRRPKKRPYRTPALRTYGDLKTLTMGKGGNRTDSAPPKTRSFGGT
jgi:hypothetical protein